MDFAYYVYHASFLKRTFWNTFLQTDWKAAILQCQSHMADISRKALYIYVLFLKNWALLHAISAAHLFFEESLEAQHIS